MESNKENNRRKFLKNMSLSALTIGLVPGVLSAKNKTINEQLNCDETTLDLYGQGPFYTPDAPTLEDGQLASSTEEGIRIIISGQVLDLECEAVIPNTVIDVWHADADGEYDNAGFNLRGVTHSNSQGFYIFETIKPGFYLNGGSYRPSHIHFKITPPGGDELITQLYFEDDPYISEDAAASITSGTYDATHRIIPLVENSEGVLEGVWDIFMEGELQEDPDIR